MTRIFNSYIKGAVPGKDKQKVGQMAPCFIKDGAILILINMEPKKTLGMPFFKLTVIHNWKYYQLMVIHYMHL